MQRGIFKKKGGIDPLIGLHALFLLCSEEKLARLVEILKYLEKTSKNTVFWGIQEKNTALWKMSGTGDPAPSGKCKYGPNAIFQRIQGQRPW